MKNNIYIARQPILNNEQNIFAYELLFRSVQEDGSILSLFDDNLLATTRVLVNSLNHIGINNLVDSHKAFINIDEELLMDNMIMTIPKERFIIELLETMTITEALVERIKSLKQEGYHFALDDAHCDPDFLQNFLPVFPYLDVLKIDIQLIDSNILEQRIQEFRKYDFMLLAEKVETEEEFKRYKELGCELFQGYFFAKPTLITQEAMDPHYKNIFNLIKTLDKDLDIDEISKEFECQADITLQLLRFMNSGHLSINNHIRSIKHAISLLGKIPLKQWLLLIAYSKSDNSNSSGVTPPLYDMAASRSRLMYDLMHILYEDKQKSHEAAFVGLLSLIHAIVHVKIEDILTELMVDKDIFQAVTEHTGELGLLLQLVIAVEEFNLENAQEIVTRLKISPESFKNALLNSMRSVDEDGA